MDNPDIHLVSFCSGTGGLDIGVELALEFLGYRARTVGYVERDAAAASALLARMEESSLEPAPIWCGALEEFPAAQFAGLVDAGSAGFPCPPVSCAGKGLGTEDERWILPAILERFRRMGCRWVFLENVRGLLSAQSGAAFGEVLRLLADFGFTWVEWAMLEAAEVGAGHERARVFIVAHSPGQRRARPCADGRRGRKPYVAGHGGGVVDPEVLGRRQRGTESARKQWGLDAAKCGVAMDPGPVAEPGRKRLQGSVERGSALESTGGGDGGIVAHSRCGTDEEGQPKRITGSVREADDREGGGELAHSGGECQGRADGAEPGSNGSGIAGVEGGAILANAQSERGEWRGSSETEERVGNPDADRASEPLANPEIEHAAIPGRAASEYRCGGSAMADPARGGRDPFDSADSIQPNGDARKITGVGSGRVFAPGPSDAGWPSILEREPHLSPALESGVRGMAYGESVVLDQDRADQLRMSGNGCVALQAACAFVHLLRRFGVGRGEAGE